MGSQGAFPGILEIISESGIFGYAILLYVVFLAGAIIQQFRKAQETDFSSVLWGLVFGLVALGVLGTAVGQIHAAAAYLSLGDQVGPDMLILAWRISLGPVVLSSLLGVVGAIATGFAANKARRCALSS